MLRIHRIRLAVCWMIVLSCLDSSASHAGPSVNGRWTDKYAPAARWLNTGGHPSPAVHMILTRGYGGFHSQILWYDSHSGTPPAFHGGVMGWKPESTAVDGDCTTYPATRLTPLALGNPPSDIFCSAHAALASGRVLVSGGTESGEVGITSSVLFDPATRSWSPQGTMQQRRWYPTNTTLPDGRIMTSSGSRFGQLHGFGGRNNVGTLATDSLEFLGMTLAGEWNGRGKTVGIAWPQAREAHASCWNPTNSEWTLFGGRDSIGGYLQDTYFMYQNPDKDQREDYTAVDVGGGASRPSRRAWSSLVAPGDTVVLFGGLDADSARSDTWSLWKEFIPPSTVIWRWRDLAPFIGNSPPAARHGHTAVWDSTNRKMLVFGGAKADGTPLDSTLHALSILPTGVGSWSQPTVNPDPDFGRPLMRDGHVFVLDPYKRTTAYDGAPSGYQRRYVLFGGRRGSVILDDLWVLWVPDPGAGNYQWKKVNPPFARPAARFHLAADFDFNDRFVITGGGRHYVPGPPLSPQIH